MMLKRWLSFILLASLFAILLPFSIKANAAGIYVPVAGGSVTQANIRISAVDGTSFIDFSAADVLTTKIGDLLRIKDSAGKVIQGFIKAAGTGETLGAELVPNWINSTGNWDTFIAATKDITSAIGLTNLYRLAVSNDTSSIGWLLKHVITVTLNSGQMPEHLWLDGVTYISNGFLTGGADTYYMTRRAASHSVYLQSTLATNYSAISVFKQVTAPAATGVTITSTKGGSTFNYAAKDSAFNYNDASGYTYEILKVNNAIEVASGSIAANEMLADTTAGNAFVAPVGVDLGAFQDGRHMFWAQNTATGYVAFGYISSTPPAGETLGSELVNNGGFASDPTVEWGAYLATLTSEAGGQAGNCLKSVRNGGQLFAAMQDMSVTIGSLYTFSGYGKNGDAVSGFQFRLGIATYGTQYYDSGYQTDAGFTQYSKHLTASASGLYISLFGNGNADGQYIYFDTITLKQVTAPASTGARIVSTQGGATRAWAYKHASFDPNAASTYKVFFIGD